MIPNEREISIMKVSGTSNVNKTAGSIVKHFEDGRDIEIVTVGAGSLNQAQKAVIAASMILASRGATIYERSSFTKVMIEGEERTAISKRLIFAKG